MNLQDFKKIDLPEEPGVYFFKKKAGLSGTSKKPEILYIGKATSLRDRVRSYLSDDLIKTRGRLLVDMVTLADTIEYQTTDSVLEAYLLENELIKVHQPRYNTKEKDNKSFNYVVMTKEDFPQVLTVRGRDLQQQFKADSKAKRSKYLDVFGPYPYGNELREAAKLVRRIFPFRDNKCVPYEGPRDENGHATPEQRPRPCFNRTIGLCPGVCTGEISEKEYAEQIRHIRLFFKGKKNEVVSELEGEMKALAKAQKFEQANVVKKTLLALSHIQDISLIKKEGRLSDPERMPDYVTGVSTADLHVEYEEGEHKDFKRIESYDIAHMSGKDMVGVMTVVHVYDREGMADVELAKSEYKKFNIKTQKGSNDTGALKEVLLRRFKHFEWRYPDIIVIDGGQAQLNAAEAVLKEVLEGISENAVAHGSSSTEAVFGNDAVSVPTLISVVKDDRHKARDICISEAYPPKDAGFDRKELFELAVQANAETHRFAIAFHRRKRSISWRLGKRK